MKKIVLICDIDVKKGSSYFDFLMQLTSPRFQFILLARSINDDAYNDLYSKGYCYSSFAGTWQLTRLLHRHKPHLIHLHFYGIGHPYTFIARCFSSNIILTMHNSPPKEYQITSLRKIKQKLLSMPLSRLCAISPFIEDWLGQFIAKEKIFLINNGINLSRFEYEKVPPLQTKLRCFYVGSLSSEKGLHYLLTLFSEPSLSHIAQLDIFGDGELKEQVELTANKAQSIHYHGRSTHIEQDLKQAHIVLMPSCWQEAFGYVAIEAMAVGRPVVAEPIGGLADLFVDQKQGWYVHFEQPEQVQKLLMLIYNKSEVLADVSLAARERVEQEYDIQRQITQTHEMYTSLLGIE
ncbi:glycosyltransferase family 4 protein [Photobacterium leiognathi]|uniref:glycosyltransferase family 4 protein n=1 Tax=Photobacterium leiognathi TaxID=553611 RepID=UPI002981C593|nr:glycosyltransferase family 4 protein [Photobacterium leiognathi]